jgi:hypothetical protein
MQLRFSHVYTIKLRISTIDNYACFQNMKKNTTIFMLMYCYLKLLEIMQLYIDINSYEYIYI